MSGLSEASCRPATVHCGRRTTPHASCPPRPHSCQRTDPSIEGWPYLASFKAVGLEVDFGAAVGHTSLPGIGVEIPRPGVSNYKVGGRE